MQEIQVINQQQFKTFLPKLFNETGQLKKSGIISLAPKTIVEAVQSQTPQLSFLTRECGPILVQAAIAIILKDIFDLTLSPAANNPDAIAAMAGEIQSNFWMLKYDEIVFAVKKGINAGYTGKEGKHFGHINYQHISEWLHAYCIESDTAINDLRDKEHERYKSPFYSQEFMMNIDTDIIQKIGATAEKIERKTKQPNMSWEEVQKRGEDDRRFILIDKQGKNFYMKQLLELGKEAKENNWVRTVEAIREELKKRIPISVKMLAKNYYSGDYEFTEEDIETANNYPEEYSLAKTIFKNKFMLEILAANMAAGKTEFTEEELQLQQNFPEHLEIELKKLQQ